MKDTPSLYNAYKRFGNTMYLNRWFNNHALIGIMRPVVDNKTINISRKPKHWKNAVQLEYRPAERLKMGKRFADMAIVSRNGRYLKNFDPKSPIELEKFARKKIKHDWQVEIIGAWETLIYQRQGWKKWLLIAIGNGYA